jgi:hypothetical protein
VGPATYGYVETDETQSSVGVDRNLAIGKSNRTGSSLNADDDFIRVTQAMRAINRDEGGLADETIVPSLEAVLGVWIQRKGDSPVVEDVSDWVQRRD